MKNNPTSFRVFGPDETASNRLQALYEASKKTWLADMLPEDADGGELAPDGRVMELLSEHTLLGWLEGYLLTGRHGFFHTYEAFAHVIDSMFNQHAKWLDISKNHVAWRAPVASENILLSSTVWRQDHNGFSHQDPGFIDLVTNKGPSVTRVYLPPDANTLLSVADHCLRSTDYINVIVADKQKHLQFTTIDEAIVHCAKGLGIWPRASTDAGEEPDVVLACCGDVATMEALAAAALLRERVPDLKLRFVNVVDLFKLQPASEHPHGSTEREFDSLFTTDKPIIFNFHGYPWLIHKLSYRFKGHANLHVRGYKEKGNINTPLELAMLNETSRFHLVIDVIDRVPKLLRHGRASEGRDEERDHRQPPLRARTRHGSAGDCGVDMAALSRARRGIGAIVLALAGSSATAAGQSLQVDPQPQRPAFTLAPGAAEAFVAAAGNQPAPAWYTEGRACEGCPRRRVGRSIFQLTMVNVALRPGKPGPRPGDGACDAEDLVGQHGAGLGLGPG